MKSAEGIKFLIIICLILTGVYVWTLAPVTGQDVIYIARGAENASISPMEIPTPDPLKIPAQEQQPASPEDPEQRHAIAFVEPAADVEAGYLILINKTNSLEAGYKPADLVAIKYYAPDRSPEGRFLRAAAADALHDLIEAAARDGYLLKLTTGYRSYGFQELLYNNYVKKYGQEEADKFSAMPGKSEHQTGLAADVSAPSVDYQLSAAFGETKEGLWLASHAHLFGFIIRYPQGGEKITGYQYEPWHIRYVGEKAAQCIYEEEITLEEYLEQIE